MSNFVSQNSERKNPGSRMFPGFFDVSKLRLTLAELRSASRGLEAVLGWDRTLKPLILLVFLAVLPFFPPLFNY